MLSSRRKKNVLYTMLSLLFISFQQWGEIKVLTINYNALRMSILLYETWP